MPYPIIINHSHSVEVSFLGQCLDRIHQRVASLDRVERVAASKRRPHDVFHGDLTEALLLHKQTGLINEAKERMVFIYLAEQRPEVLSRGKLRATKMVAHVGNDVSHVQKAVPFPSSLLQHWHREEVVLDQALQVEGGVRMSTLIAGQLKEDRTLNTSMILSVLSATKTVF